MRKTIGGCLLAGALVFSGCSLSRGMGVGGSGMAEKSASEMSQDMPNEGATNFHGMVVPTTEKEFLERLHMVNMMEIQGGKLAQTQSQSPQVKAFGQQMIDAHTRADQQLMEYAKSRGMELSAAPKPISDQERRMMAADLTQMQKLATLRDEAFDKAYLASQVSMHDAAMTKLMAGQRAFTSGPVANMTRKMSQEVSMHRQQAYRLLGEMAPQPAGVGGSGMEDAGMEDRMMDREGAEQK